MSIALLLRTRARQAPATGNSALERQLLTGLLGKGVPDEILQPAMLTRPRERAPG
jgi:hypothetical protein